MHYVDNPLYSKIDSNSLPLRSGTSKMIIKGRVLISPIRTHNLGVDDLNK